MDRSTHLRLFALILACLVTGCASAPRQPTITTNAQIFSNPSLRTGFVYVAPKKEATTHIMGASCLLCYAVAASLTGSLDSHLKRAIKQEELHNIKDLVWSIYAEKTNKLKEVTLPTSITQLEKFKSELGSPEKDFRPLKEQLEVDVLIVVSIGAHGAYRSFTNYLPTSDPMGYVSGTVYAVDLSNNAYISYLELNEMVQPQGQWDEAPNYPNVTNAYYQAVENAKHKISVNL